MKVNDKAVVLLSGGLDSATVLAIAKDMGYRLYTLSFSYGQRHVFELEAARKISQAMGAEKHLVINMNLNDIGGSALTDNIDVPKGRSVSEMTGDIPVTYVPARNTIFLSFALGWAEVLGVSDIFIGVNAVDYSGYPDCRPEYIKAYEVMANLATKTGVEKKTFLQIQTPLITLSKAQIIQKGRALGVDYSMTHSCYDPDNHGRACGQCDSCLLRKKGFESAGVPDPTVYA
ncbi:MAG: 7-cyano-7-deazaguanine synthase QueC [Desulfobacteraceae bacterium]|jgi:7-cyano-7-deazaguanine synthase